MCFSKLNINVWFSKSNIWKIYFILYYYFTIETFFIYFFSVHLKMFMCRSFARAENNIFYMALKGIFCQKFTLHFRPFSLHRLLYLSR